MDEQFINDYKAFLDSGKTERECVESIKALAEKHGYKDLASVESVNAGSRVYVTKMNKSIALFELGSDPLEKGMDILGAHIDSPRLDVKQNPIMEKDFICYINTHYYGGIKKYQWVTIPLAIHGVVCKTDGTTVKINVGEEENDPVFCISDILPHLAQKQMKENAAEFISGESLDLIAGSVVPPKKDKKEEEKKDDKKDDKKGACKKAVLKILEAKYGIKEADFMSAELEVVPAGKTRDLGFDRSLILGYGQDDRSCAYTSLRALLDGETQAHTRCCVCVDKEEIGSVGATGMASHFFENAVAELVAKAGAYSDLTLRRCLENSNMLSSDVNAAFDPQNTDLFDRDNASFLGAGIVFNKYTGSRGKYSANDANPEYIARVRAVLEAANIPYQMSELGKVDQGGGGTIAYLAAKYGMNVIDAGVPVLSMHAPWEITAKEDIYQAYEAYKAFLTL
jgi:aspartyl aminopeptidase